LLRANLLNDLDNGSLGVIHKRFTRMSVNIVVSFSSITFSAFFHMSPIEDVNATPGDSARILVIN
jgi:hypothetical protein